MRMLVARIVIVGLVVALFGAVAGSPPTFASSDLSAGTTRTSDPVNRRDTGLATCHIFIGPMDGVPDGQFLLEISDIHTTGADDRMELRGTAVQRDGGIFLSADDAAAEDFYQQVLRTKIHRPASEIDLQRFVITIVQEQVGGARFITCSIDMAGVLTGAADAHGRVIYAYEGPGTEFVGVQAQQSATGDAAGVADCNNEIRQDPDRCATPDCLVTFAGYKWWTEVNFDDGGSGPYNGGQKTIFAPRNVTVDAEGLHLFARQVDVDGNGVLKWAGADAAVARNPDGSRANLGYGTYLVAAKAKTPSVWDKLDPNVAFGAFTYEREKVQNASNPYRELDLAEISHWGISPGGSCGLNPKLCEGNAQFALQLWDKGGSSLPNVSRYTIGASVTDITLVMIWTGGGKPVTFRQYNGRFTLATLPAQPDHEWITPSARNTFVPDDHCQQFHVNMWMGNYAGTVNGLNPPPATPQEIVVTGFEYKPQQ